MAEDKIDHDAEFAAMQTVYTALAPLKEEARNRVVDYVVARLEIARQARPADSRGEAKASDDDVAIGKEAAEAPMYGAFAELHDAALPQTRSDKALVAGYWLQVCQGAESFDGFSANKELKNLGEGVTNITGAIDNLKGQKPALALQLKKSGKSRQARKTYKITVAGIKSVEAMING